MMRLMAERRDDPDEPEPPFDPVPEAWVARALEVPLLHEALDLLKATETGAERNGDLDAMRSALAAVGLEPDEKRLKALARLKELHSDG
jgi:hypothetical protein